MLDFDTFSNFTKFARLSFLSNGKSEGYYWRFVLTNVSPRADGAKRRGGY